MTRDSDTRPTGRDVEQVDVEWRRLTLPPYRAYEVSADGRVRRGAREMVGYVDRYGYRTVLLSYAGLSRRFKVHRLVCEMFHGPCPDGLECAHRDGDTSNNSATNLAWVTRSENTLHTIVHGTFAGHRNLTPGVGAGEAHPCAKLTEESVAAIRAAVASGETQRAVARQFGISQTQVCHIASGKKWPERQSPHHFDNAAEIAARIRKNIPPSRPVFVRVAV